MQRKFGFLALAVSILIVGCGGGGSPTQVDTLADDIAPVMNSVAASLPTPGTLRLTASATDAVGVTGYCFKSTADKPAATDACFQEAAVKDFPLSQVLTLQYLWARDEAGNVSASPLRGPCSSEGLLASDSSDTNTVCMMTSLGELVFQLEPIKAPITTANFLKYVNDGFYSSTVFHRVISTFMVQGGGYDTDLNYKTPTYSPITLETPATTGLSNTVGTIAMARTSALNSATSQFFVNVADNSALDTAGGGYAVFGHLISGESTLAAIKAVPVVSNGSELSSPVTPPVIQWVLQVK